MSFDNWTAKLAGEEVGTFLQPQPEDEGYYRKPVVEPMLGRDGRPNGKKRTVGWIPVGYFMDEDSPGAIYCLTGIGDDQKLITGNAALDEELWSYACRNPISYAEWVRVAENGEPWSDLPTPIVKDSESKSHKDYLAAIHAAMTASPNKITSKDDAEEALGIKNTIADLRIEATKIGKSIYEPLYVAYTREQKPWTSVVKVAETAEKAIRDAVDAFSEQERQRILKEKIEIEARLAAEEGRNARAADRAIARGEPEALEIEDIEIPGEVTPLKPTTGRAYKQELKTFVTITDEAAVATFFRGNAELVAVLQKLAERAVKLGQEVPGTTTREGYA